MFLSVGPLLLAATGVFHAAGSDTTAFAQRLVEHQDLTGETAHLVRVTFGTAATTHLSPRQQPSSGLLLGIEIGQPMLLRVFGHWAWAKSRWLGRVLPTSPSAIRNAHGRLVKTAISSA
jgi:hypothetical protein